MAIHGGGSEQKARKLSLAGFGTDRLVYFSTWSVESSRQRRRNSCRAAGRIATRVIVPVDPPRGRNSGESGAGTAFLAM